MVDTSVAHVAVPVSDVQKDVFAIAKKHSLQVRRVKTFRIRDDHIIYDDVWIGDQDLRNFKAELEQKYGSFEEDAIPHHNALGSKTMSELVGIITKMETKRLLSQA